MKEYDTNVQPTKDASERDMSADDRRLVHLDDVKDQFKVAEGNPDIRGWDVKTTDGRKVGEVDGLIIDTGKRKVRYLESKIDKDVLGTDDDQWMLLPIGRARLDDDKDEVLLSTSASDLRNMPISKHSHGRGHGRFTQEEERSLRNRFGAKSENRSMTSDMSRDDMYRGDDYDDSRFFGNRARSGSGKTGPSYFVPIAVVEEVVVTRPVSRDDARETSSTSDTRQRSPRGTESRNETR